MIIGNLPPDPVKMGSLIGSVVLILVVATMCAAQSCKPSKNYCTICSDHAACQDLPSQCSRMTNVQFIDIDKEVQDYILYLSNDLRNSVANGSRTDRKLPPAARMASLTYNCELAYLAKKNVEQCEMKHDTCMDDGSSSGFGQNLAVFGNSAKTIDLKTVVRMAVENWFNEIKLVTRADIDRLPEPNEKRKIGHFTQMVQQEATSIGCAAVNYFDGQFYQSLIACDYSYPNVWGKNVYQSSPQAGSKCRTGRHATFKALCSPKEVYP